MLEVLMEDPVAPEDETKLQQRIETLQIQQAELGLETYRLAKNVKDKEIDLPQISTDSSKPEFSDTHYVNQINSELPSSANPAQLGLHNIIVNPKFMGSQASVKQKNIGTATYVNPPDSDLHK